LGNPVQTPKKTSFPHTAEDLRQDPNYPVWTRLRSGDLTARGELVARYSPLVKFVFGRMAIRTSGAMDVDDILAAGTIGLLHAIDRFNPEQGVRFETYALQRIRGAIIDAIRTLSPISRGAIRRNRVLDQSISELTQRLGREPTRDEVSCELGVDSTELRRMMVDSTHSVVSLDNWGEDDNDRSSLGELLHDPDTLATDDMAFEPDEILRRLSEALRSLPKRDQLVLNQYYNNELTLKQISREIKVSESRVSQIRSGAVVKLSNLLGPRQPAWAA
jgi:RNA polymerase sigma factor for flagellar operon FliA